MSAIGQIGTWCNRKIHAMTYGLLASLHVGDTLKLSNAFRESEQLFKVIAIEHDVDELGTPLCLLSHPRTIRVRARPMDSANTVVPSHFFATEDW